MLHRKKINHLGRTANHRKAMLANMANSLIIHKRVSTTTAKAKALRTYVEPLISKTKNLTTVEEKTHAQRVVFSYLQSKEAVKELFTDIAPKVESRPGGYTRILKTGTRLGDSSEMCIIELVDYNENLLAAKDDSKSKTGRKRRKSSGKKQAEVSAPVATAVVEDEKLEEPNTDEEKSE
jgi:large subunit ribosomal protein L17